MSEFSPFSAEMSDMELAVTKSRIKSWRLNRRRAHSQLPAVRAVYEAFCGGQIWRLLSEISERLASLFPQAQVLQRKQACLTADWRE